MDWKALQQRTDWRSLRHRLGPATRVPKQLRKLCDDDYSEAHEAFDVLHETLLGAGEWFSATAPAVGALLDIVGDAPRPAWLWFLLAEMLGADHVRGWLAPPEKGPPSDVVAVVAARLDWLEKAAHADDPAVRATMQLVWAMLPGFSEQSLPLLRRAAQADDEPTVRASALLALGRIGCTDQRSLALLQAVRDDRVALPMVRGAAVLAGMRADPCSSLSGAGGEIEAWLSWENPTEDIGSLPWFGGLSPLRVRQFLNAPAQGLADFAASRDQGEALVELSFGWGATSERPTVAKHAGDLILWLGDFAHFGGGWRGSREAVLFENLSPEQAHLVRRLASTRLLPEPGVGLPASGLPRLRWCGLVPQGPLDSIVEVELNRESRRVPLWYAVFGNSFEEVRAQWLQPLSPDDRWQASLELAAGCYGKRAEISVAAAEIEQLLSEAVGSERLLRARGLADDFALRAARSIRNAVGRRRLPSKLRGRAGHVSPMVEWR